MLQVNISQETELLTTYYQTGLPAIKNGIFDRSTVAYTEMGSIAAQLLHL